MYKMNELQKIFENNQLIMKLYSLYISEYNNSINKSQVEELSSTCDIDLEYAFYLLFVNYLGLDIVDNKEHLELANEYIRPYLKCLDENTYNTNPYYCNVTPNEKKKGKWTLKYLTYKPYELFVCDDLKINKYKEFPNVGYFKNEFKYLAVLEDNHEWMLITPNEIETMKEPIKKAFGKVITFGLGLGYFAYMTSIKENVESVTIIEKDQNVIDLFKSEILPFFEYKNKIKIICADAFDVFKNGINDYDYCFIDIWHDASDGVSLYAKFKKYEKINCDVIIDYWVEKTLVSYIKWYVFSHFDSLKKYDKLSNDVLIEDVLDDKFINRLLIEKN